VLGARLSVTVNRKVSEAPPEPRSGVKLAVLNGIVSATIGCRLSGHWYEQSTVQSKDPVRSARQRRGLTTWSARHRRPAVRYIYDKVSCVRIACYP